MSSSVLRIRDKRKLKIMASREKRRIETPRLPRTAKRVRASSVRTEMADLGVDMKSELDNGQQVGGINDVSKRINIASRDSHRVMRPWSRKFLGIPLGSRRAEILLFFIAKTNIAFLREKA